MLPISIIRFRSVKNTELFLKLYKIITMPFMGFNVKIFNREIINNTKPAVVVGNHQHNFDIMMASEVFAYRIVSLGKRQIGFLPFFGQIFWLAGNILITRGNKKSAMKTMKSIENYIRKKKLGIVIFPEGHRNTKEELLPFKKGAFYTAINCQVPIVPFVVSQYARHMDLNKKCPGNIYIQALEPISTEGLTEKDIPELITKVRAVLEQGIKDINKKAGY
jgi:1-acyl-sn-glycerol-3-phosphate acyltransferase